MRRELYRRARLASRKSVLDVGCGEGVITREMAEVCRGKVTGVDIDAQMVRAAQETPGQSVFKIGDACALDFKNSEFDLVACHWLMLWLKKPRAALKEFRRVLKPDGTLLIACEPDFGGRMVFPESAALNEEIIWALRAQGADPLIGRKLPGLLSDAGFKASCGLYPGVWDSSIESGVLDAEVDWLRTQLSGRVEDKKLSGAISALRENHRQGKLLIFTPVFWAIANKRD